MLTAEHIIALIRAHASGDSQRFYSVAIQVAASLAREGNEVGAKKVRDASDNARNRGSLPPFSGPTPPCRKCALPQGKAVGTRSTYIKEGGLEFMERSCGKCGYVWYERCADG